MMNLTNSLRNVLNNNPILRYITEFEKGSVVVPNDVKTVYKYLESIILDPNPKEWCYNSSFADDAVDFIQTFCKHTKGKNAGQPFILELWQEALVCAIFGFIGVEDGLRKHREVFLLVARKNGKSTLSAGIGLYLLVMDGEEGSEVYSVATKKEQAKIIWEEAKRMIQKSSALAKRLKIRVGGIFFDTMNGIFKALASDSNTLDGLNVHGLLIDELHAILDMNLYDVMVDGMASRDQPLTLITTTAGTKREGVFDVKIDEMKRVVNGLNDNDGYKDPRVLPILYALDDREEWKVEANWQKANPGLGTIKQIDNLRTKVNKALADSTLIKNLLTKDFNIPETDTQSWLSFKTINNTTEFDWLQMKPNYAIGGIDLSSTTDLTSACILYKLPDDDRLYVHIMFWIPEDLLEERMKEDDIPYDKWADKGYIRLCRGNKINLNDVTEWFKEIRDEHDVYYYKIGYDSWGSSHWIDEMRNIFGHQTMEAVPQTFKVFSVPMKSIKADLEKQLVVYNNNPVLKWCMTNVAIKVDENDNIRPVKPRNERKRIDGFVALLDAYTVYYNNRIGYESLAV